MNRKQAYAILKVESTTVPGVMITAYVQAKTWLHTFSRGSNCLAQSECDFGYGKDRTVWANRWNARLVKIVHPKKRRINAQS